MGAIPVTQSQVLYGGAALPVSVADNVSRGLAFVPQGHNVFPTLSVEQNLRISGLLFDQGFVRGCTRCSPRCGSAGRSGPAA